MKAQQRIGDYELIGVLGGGSFGTVWEARHVTLDRLSAVKILNGRSPLGGDAKRFVREAQIAASLRHPNIVQILEVGRSEQDEDEIEYLVYDLIEGVTLSDWADFAELTPRDVGALCVKLASALQSAHASGIIHRDLKPENVLIDLAGEPHITDFGLARRLDDRLTEEDITLGTVAYMSPEQARGESRDADGRSDIFSLGVILFELLTRRLPFPATTIPGYLIHVSNSPPQRPRSIVASLPKDMETICLKCLSTHAEDRYQTAAGLQADLQRFIDGRPVSARRSSGVERFRRWCLRQPLAAALLGILLLLGICGPLVALRQIRLGNELLVRTSSLEATNELLRNANYASDLYLAYQAWNQGRLQQTRVILDRATPTEEEPDLREFAWYLLNDRLNAAFEIVARSDKPINQFVFSQDKRFLIVSDDSNQLAIWDFAKRARVRSIPMMSSGHHAIAVHDDTLLVGERIGDERTGRPVLCVYDFASGHRLKTISVDAENTIETISVAPSSKRIALGLRYEGVYLYDDALNFVKCVANHGRHHALAFSPSGEFIAALFHKNGAQDAVVLIDVATCAVVRRFPVDGSVRALAWTDDGAYLSVHNGFGRGNLLQLPELEPVARLDVAPLRVNATDFVRDGRTILAGSDDGTLTAQHVNFNGTAYRTVKYMPHTSRVAVVKAQPDGSILTAGKDGMIVRTRPDIVTSLGATMIATVGNYAKMVYCQATDHGFCGDRAGVLRDLNGNEIDRFEAAIASLAMSADGRLLACGLASGKIVVMTAANLERKQTIDAASSKESQLAINYLEFYSNGQRLVAAHDDSSIQFWNLETGELVARHETTRREFQIAVSRKYALAFSTDATERIQAYRLADGQPEFRLPTDGAISLLAHPELPLLFSGHSDHSIRVWNIESRQLHAELRGQEGYVWGLTLHADGRTLASAGGSQIRFWDIHRRAEIGQAYQALDNRDVRYLAFPPHGTTLLALLSFGARPSSLIRVGAPFNDTEFTGYTVMPGQIVDFGGVDKQTTQAEGGPCLDVRTKRKRGKHLVGVWLRERCKGKEVRVSFDLDVVRGGATAYIDHWNGNDRHPTEFPNFHAASPPADHNQDRQLLRTDWFRVTHGDWTTAPRGNERSYRAVLVLPAESHVRIHSIKVECRELQ